MWSSEFTFGQSMALHILSNFVYKKLFMSIYYGLPSQTPHPIPTNQCTDLWYKMSLQRICKYIVSRFEKKVTSYVRLVLQSKWKLHSIFLSSSASMNDKPVDFQAKTFPMRFFAMKTYFILLCFNNNNLW